MSLAEPLSHGPRTAYVWDLISDVTKGGVSARAVKTVVGRKHLSPFVTFCKDDIESPCAQDLALEDGRRETSVVTSCRLRREKLGHLRKGCLSHAACDVPQISQA